MCPSSRDCKRQLPVVENVGALEFYWKMVLSGRQLRSSYYTEVLSGHGKKEKLIMPGLQHLLMLSKKRRLEVKEVTV